MPIATGTKTVTATYRMTGQADRSNTCTGSPAAVVPSGDWLSGKFGSANDIDWYRFKLTTTTRVRLVLGDLATPGRMTLYSGCSKALEVSDFGGLTPEMIIRRLPPGSYAVRLAGSGASDTPNYSFRMKRMPNTVHVMSSRTRIDGSALRIVGEVYNNTTALGRPRHGHGPALRCVGQVPGDADRPDPAVLHPTARTGAVQHRRLAAGRLPPQLPERDRAVDVEVARHPDDLDQERRRRRERPPRGQRHGPEPVHEVGRHTQGGGDVVRRAIRGARRAPGIGRQDDARARRLDHVQRHLPAVRSGTLACVRPGLGLPLSRRAVRRGRLEVDDLAEPDPVA